MTVEPSSRATSRRALIAGAAGALLTTLGALAARAVPVSGSDGDPVRLGEENEATAPTRIHRSTGGPAVLADAVGPGIGLTATTATGIGTYGLADSGIGVLGSSVSGSGVEALSPDGIALRIRRGRIRADGVSGVVRLAAGESIVSIRPAARVVHDALVLLTPMADLAGRDLWFTLGEEAGTVTIHVSEAVEEDVRIAWLMLG